MPLLLLSLLLSSSAAAPPPILSAPCWKEITPFSGPPVDRKVAPEKVKVVKAKKAEKPTKPTKLVRLSYCSSVADKARQVNLDVNGVEIPVFEVEVC